MFEGALAQVLTIVRIGATATALIVAGTAAATHPILRGSAPLIDAQPETVVARDVDVSLSSVHYELDRADPRSIDAVQLTLLNRSSSLEVSLDTFGEVWYPCTSTDGGIAWSCDTTSHGPVSVAAMSILAVRPQLDHATPAS